MKPVKYSLTDLDDSLHSGVIAYMQEKTEAFELKQVDRLLDQKHTHPDKDPHGKKNDRPYLQGLMDCGLTISAWHAKPYKQPRWGIFKEYSLVPEPTIWVDISLHCEGTLRKNEIFSALAPDINGVVKQCTYVKKPEIKRKRTPRAKADSLAQSKSEI